ncbi:CrcB family protein [Staphylococcus roterodami]|nr:CrcB family protein [Staphylococcus roterodami]UMT79902.1 CrcB family protein [Staphylococcus roterodami]
MIATLLVMIGGGFGAVVRGALTDYCNAKFKSQLPIPTLIVNLIGSFLIGLIMGMAISNTWLPALLVTGFLGGLTTFSTLAKELTLMMTPKLKLTHFINYSLLQFIIGFIACYIGFHI